MKHRTNTTQSRLQIAWGRLKDIEFKSVAKAFNFLVAAVPAISLVAALVYQIAIQLFDDSLAIQPLSVPRTIAEDGYTPDVTAQKLNDAVADVIHSGRTRLEQEHVFVETEAPEAMTPGTGNSLKVFLSSALRYLHLSNRNFVSGEITQGKDGFLLTVRMSSEQAAFRFGPGQDLADLLRQGGRKIVWQTQPYFVASADYRTNVVDPRIPNELKSIIKDRPWGDSNRVAAINLRGIIERDANNYAAAERDFVSALDEGKNLDRWILATIHNNYGSTLVDEGEPDLAEIEFKRAIILDCSNSLAHSGLAKIFSDRKSYDAAIEQYQRAIAVDWHNSYAHYGLGDVFRMRPDLGNAEGQYWIAIDRNPDFGFPYIRLGEMHYLRRDFVKAARYFSIGAKLGNEKPELHLIYGAILRNEGKIKAAIAQYDLAAASHSNYANVARARLALLQLPSRIPIKKDARAR
ncbi:MAG TPA: tetratricopeptide repeat protein [Rhizomicrobium sp.]